MNRLVRRLAPGWGRRQLALISVGTIWITFGVSVLTTPPQTQRFGPQIAPFDQVLNSRGMGWLWIVCGALAGTFGLLRRVSATGYGFGTLLAPALLWTLLYNWSWVTFWATQGQFGSARAWVGVTSWAGSVFLILLIAGWPEPPSPPPPSPPPSGKTPEGGE